MPTLCLPDSIDTPSPARSSSMNQVHRPPAPAVNWRTHLSLLLLALVYVFSYIDRNVIAILIEPIKREFGASDTAMGLLTGLAFGVLYAVMGIPLGRLADQGFNRRNMVAMACGLWSLATMACGMAGQFWQLMIARMTVAIGEAGGMAPSMSMVSDLYPKERRSIAISLFMMGPHIGMILAMALGGWIAQQHGWRATFLFFGIPGLVLATLLWLIVREPRRGGFDGVPTAATQPAQPLLAQLRGLMGIRAFLLVCLACGLGGIAGYGYGIWGPSFLMRSHDLPLAQAGLLFGLASGLGAASGAIFGGWYCDRLTRRDPRWQLRLPMIGALLGLPMGFAFLLWPAGNWQLGSLAVPHAMIFAVGFGFFNAWWPPLCYAATSHMMAPNQRALGAAMLNLFLTLFGAGLGPLISGALSDLFVSRFGPGSLRYALLLTLFLLGLTAVLLGMGIRSYVQRLEALKAR